MFADIDQDVNEEWWVEFNFSLQSCKYVEANFEVFICVEGSYI